MIHNDNAIVFFTAPLANRYYPWNIDLDSILTTIVLACYVQSVNLIIRVHPLENISFYKKKINAIQRYFHITCDISYNQHTPIDDVLKKSYAAIHFESTLFMECLKHRVPIINFAWYKFAYQDELDKLNIFNYANSLQDLFYLICEAVNKKLPIHEVDVNLFSVHTSSAVIKKYFQKIMDQ